MKRVAFCSPLNPLKSGISDYSEELLPFLGQYVDITVFVDDGLHVTNQALREHLPVYAINQLPAMHRQQAFDAVIYHMGNSEYHSRFYELLADVPGVVVLHDYVLHHMMLWYAANRLKDLEWYQNQVEQRYGAEGRRVALMMQRGQLSDAIFEYPLSESVIEQAQALIAHSAYVAERARAVNPGLLVEVVPMGVPLPDILDRAGARKLLNLPLDAPVWASFGHVNPYKRVEQSLRAFARFRDLYPTALYVLVGSVSPHFKLDTLIQRLGISECVYVTGYVSNAAFMHYVAATDFCFNGRFPSAGETSASLLRVLGAGRAVLVSDVATFSELPASVVAHVPVDAAEESVILDYAQALWSTPALRKALENNARSYIAQQHTLQGAAEGYVRLLEKRYGWATQSIERDPLWQLEDVTFRAPVKASGIIGQRAAELGIRGSAVNLLDRAVARIQKLVK